MDNDSTNYEINVVKQRLRKASAKSTQAVVRDQIRLALRTLDKITAPAQPDTEPIDIFIF